MSIDRRDDTLLQWKKKWGNVDDVVLKRNYELITRIVKERHELMDFIDVLEEDMKKLIDDAEEFSKVVLKKLRAERKRLTDQIKELKIEVKDCETRSNTSIVKIKALQSKVAELDKKLNVNEKCVEKVSQCENYVKETNAVMEENYPRTALPSALKEINARKRKLEQLTSDLKKKFKVFVDDEEDEKIDDGERTPTRAGPSSPKIKYEVKKEDEEMVYALDEVEENAGPSNYQTPEELEMDDDAFCARYNGERDNCKREVLNKGSRRNCSFQDDGRCLSQAQVAAIDALKNGVSTRPSNKNLK